MANVEKNVNDTKTIEDEKENSKDESADGSSDPNENESDEEMEEPNHYYKPEDLIAALNRVKNVPPDFVITFELQHSPLIVIAKSEKDDRVTFPIYNRVIDETNSMQLNSDGFQIKNPGWDEYLHNVIIPKIKFKMVLDFEFKPILKSFWIVQSPSEVTSLVQNEFDENTFGALLIQLPSKFVGGEHKIFPSTSTSDYQYERNFDWSSKSDAKFEFSPYCIVFHRDYQHKMKPITSGVGAYLIYELRVNNSDVAHLPKTPSFEDYWSEVDLRSMLNNWREPGKIVIGLTNDYAKEDLSLENLKPADLTIAMQLKKQYAFLGDYGRYECFLGYLTRTFHGQVSVEDTRFDTKDSSNILQTVYNIECLKHINGKEMVYFNDFNVKFDEEVWPANIFEGVQPYQCKRERFPALYIDPWDYHEVGLHVAKYYRRPVIVLFVRYNLIDELKKSYVDVADIYKIFITLYREYERNPVGERSFQSSNRFKIWAWTISHMFLPKNQQNTKHSRDLTINFLKVVLSLGDTTYDTRAFKNYFECKKRVLTEDIIPLLIDQCNKCNWLPFCQALCDMFKKIKRFSQSQKFLNYFIDDTGNGVGDISNKKMVLRSILNSILEKEKGKHNYDFKNFFHSVWNLAKKCELDICPYGKMQGTHLMVPFLIEMAEQDENNKSDDAWVHLSNHFLNQLESQNTKNQELKMRRQNVITNLLEKLRSICRIKLVSLYCYC